MEILKHFAKLIGHFYKDMCSCVVCKASLILNVLRNCMTAS